MAGVIHLWLPGDVSEAGEFRYRRFLATPTEAFASAADSLGSDLVVALQEPYVASGYAIFGTVSSVCNSDRCSTAALALSRWIRASRVVRFDRISTRLPLGPMASQIAEEFTRDLVGAAGPLCSWHGLPASAHTESRRVGRGLNWPLRQILGKPLRMVTKNKAAPSRWPRIFAADEHPAPACADFRLNARKFVGHNPTREDSRSCHLPYVETVHESSGRGLMWRFTLFGLRRGRGEEGVETCTQLMVCIHSATLRHLSASFACVPLRPHAHVNTFTSPINEAAQRQYRTRRPR
jgi:hypothetical protein